MLAKIEDPYAAWTSQPSATLGRFNLDASSSCDEGKGLSPGFGLLYVLLYA